MSFPIFADTKRTTELSLKERKTGIATLEALSQTTTISKSFILNFFGVLFIYFVPAISNLINLPLYYIEPMRLMLLVAIIYSSKRNAFFIALSLPVFSFIISAHPIFPKMIIMTLELGINVWLFYLFARLFKNYFSAMLLSIILSKAVYFMAEMIFVNLGWLTSDTIVSTPLYMQAVVAVVLSGYLFVMLTRKESPDPIVDPTR